MSNGFPIFDSVGGGEIKELIDRLTEENAIETVKEYITTHLLNKVFTAEISPKVQFSVHIYKALRDHCMVTLKGLAKKDREKLLQQSKRMLVCSIQIKQILKEGVYRDWHKSYYPPQKGGNAKHAGDVFIYVTKLIRFPGVPPFQTILAIRLPNTGQPSAYKIINPGMLGYDSKNLQIT